MELVKKMVKYGHLLYLRSEGNEEEYRCDSFVVKHKNKRRMAKEDLERLYGVFERQFISKG